MDDLFRIKNFLAACLLKLVFSKKGGEAIKHHI